MASNAKDKVHELPQDLEELRLMKESLEFKRQDPSDKYFIVDRMAEGGYARVFHVKRASDQKSFALKFIQPKDKNDYNNVRNEVAIMMMCQEGDCILQCIEIYDWLEKLWVFLEIMDLGAITDVLEHEKGNIDENICAYILK